MIQHLVLTVNPNSKYNWDRVSLRDPLSNLAPDLAELVAKSVDGSPAQHLVEVEITVKVLSSQAIAPDPVAVEPIVMLQEATQIMNEMSELAA